MTMERQREGLAIQKTPREDTEDTVETPRVQYSHQNVEWRYHGQQKDDRVSILVTSR
jgi:hypothetical protein